MIDQVKTFIIAEAGSTWNPEPYGMYRLIDIAKDCGADACKFQWTSSAKRLAERRHAPELAEPYKILEWPASWHHTLKQRCDTVGLEYMCTVYLPEDVPVIASYVRRFKIASLEAMDRELILACRPFRKPIIISTGIFTGAEVSSLVPHLYSGDTLMQCVSAYPCPIDQANLGVIHVLHGIDLYSGPGLNLGFSDHTAHVLTGALAVAAGAEVIEVHFRLDFTPPENPDYGHSLTPSQLKVYVENVRFAEKMMGSGEKKIQESEQANFRFRVKG